MRLYRAGEVGFGERLKEIVGRAEVLQEGVEAAVREIVSTVRQRGDRALLEYTRRFDGVDLTSQGLQVGADEMEDAYRDVTDENLGALQLAAQRIRTFHESQKQASWIVDLGEGSWTGQLIRPLSRVGVYVPGGKAVYPSSVLMNVVPARVAGVKEVFLCTPPSSSGKLDPHVLVAAHLAGVEVVFKVGGAQAIAALAFGTETIPRVDKVVGPGNIYVTAAKRLVYGWVGIDLLAGPSEVVIVADETAHPNLVAADLLAQAEHDEQALAVLVTPAESLAQEVQGELDRQISSLSRAEIARQALEARGAIFVVEDVGAAVRLAEEIAPEHLELLVRDPWSLANTVRNAGAIFLGESSPLALGDYLAGPNHVLPTGGAARFSSPLGVYDFVKRTNILGCSPEGLQELLGAGARLARLEGLDGHAQSLVARRKA